MLEVGEIATVPPGADGRGVGDEAEEVRVVEGSEPDLGQLGHVLELARLENEMHVLRLQGCHPCY